MMKRFFPFLVLLFVTSVMSAANHFRNPVLWADVPDPDVIRVGNDYYMVSTTMHLMPGAPIMHSKDLVNWKTVGYVFNRLTDSPKYDLKGGTVYGRGQWATSLKCHKGKFYALFAPNDNPGGDTYIYTASHASGPWILTSRMRHFHDASLFFDDDDRVYVVYGTGQMCELKQDLSGVKPNSEVKLLERDSTETGLLEGSRMVKVHGKYYLMMISWPQGKPRRQLCFRADNINGPYEKKVVLQTQFAGFPYVGQGTIVDTQKGDWYGLIFQDRGGVGRVLTLEPCRWIDGWPMLGDENGHIPEIMEKPVMGYDDGGVVENDDFEGNRLSLAWQWNHNPVDSCWTLKERKGWLRLKTSRVVDNMFVAPNTLTQRMEGPKCVGIVKMDVSKMCDGDVAGFSVFQNDAAQVSICRQNKCRYLTATTTSVDLEDKDKKVKSVTAEEKIRMKWKADVVFFRIEADFSLNKDLATLSYSIDGKSWIPLIKDFKIIFDFRRFFMGGRFAIFNYATKQLGGYVDVDYFHYHN